VPLTGQFRETPFADLVQFYGLSKQSVALAIRISPRSPSPDGIFYFERGDLVEAHLDGAEGREAVRRALRLSDGTFQVEVGATPPHPARREEWNRVVFEELVRLDEERRARPAPPAPVRTGAGAGTPAGAKHAGALALGQASHPATSASGGAGARPAGPGGGSGASGPGARPPPPPRSRGTLAVVVVAAALLVGGTAAYVLTRKPGEVRPAEGPTPAAAPAAPRPGKVRGVTDAEVVFGMASGFTGATRELGRAMKTGIETAFAAANDAGGVHGRKLRLVALDDGYEPARTGEVMKRLVEQENVFAVVGNVGSATAAVSIPYCLEQKVVFFGALSGAEVLRKQPPDRYVFNFRPSYAEETAAAVRYLADVRRIEPRRIAVFAQQDDFGESGHRGAVKQLGERGVEAARVLKLGYKRNTADVGEAVAALRTHASDVDAVVMVATYKAAAAFIRKVRDAGLSPIFTNVSPVDSNALAEELVSAGPRYASEVIVTQIVPLPGSSATSVLKYQKALERYAPGEKPDFLTLEGWVVGNLLREGLERAGKDLDTDRLVQALEGIQGLDVGLGTRLTFGPAEHQASHKVWGTALQPDGTYRSVDLE